MNRAHSVVASCIVFTAAPVAGQDPNALSFAADFFAPFRPLTALDMVRRVPGYTFIQGDADVRGFAGAAGNVLIDGRRPASKTDTLEQLLARIPAAAIERIELIRPGARGIDMAGQSILANVVRRTEAVRRMQQELGLTVVRDGRLLPSARTEMSHRAGGMLTEGSAAIVRTADDELGRGKRPRFSAADTLLRDTVYDELGDSFTGTLNVAHERPLASGRLRVNLTGKHERERGLTAQRATLAPPFLERNRLLERELNGELGVNWDGRLGAKWTLELATIRSLSHERTREIADSDSVIERLDQKSRAAESVQRAVLRSQPSSKIVIETGVEGSRTSLRRNTRLSVDDAEIPLPASSVKIVELRGEAFGTATWRPAPAWSLEAGGRIELSRLRQTGDVRLSRSFAYPKPRIQASWTAPDGTQVRLGIERTVGQLDFQDFASTASLTLDTVTAGNARLVPDRRTIFSAAGERRFAGGIALILTYRHAAITDVLDRVPIFGPDFAFDAPGNIGTGAIDSLEASLTLPLDRIGLAGGLLKATALGQRTRADDPTTDERRKISGELPFTGEMHVTQAPPGSTLSWGVDAVWREVDPEYRFNEVRRESRGTKLNLFADWRFAAEWNLRLFADNILERTVALHRSVFDGPRSTAGLDFRERRQVKVPVRFGFVLRRSLGGSQIGDQSPPPR